MLIDKIVFQILLLEFPEVFKIKEGSFKDLFRKLQVSYALVKIIKDYLKRVYI